MNPTLEDLYRNMPEDGVSPEYDAARAAKVREIAAHIAPHLIDAVDADRLAEEIMGGAEEQGRISGDEVHGEVPSRYTRSGNPIPL